jgi:hypothetical protein
MHRARGRLSEAGSGSRGGGVAGWLRGGVALVRLVIVRGRLPRVRESSGPLGG